MKKIVLALLFLCLICCSCGKKSVINDDLTTITQRDRLIVGIRNDAPPFGFKDKNGFTVGYDADLARLIAKGILGDEKKVEFVIWNSAYHQYDSIDWLWRLRRNRRKEPV